jgi:hypothetical protein
MGEGMRSDECVWGGLCVWVDCVWVDCVCGLCVWIVCVDCTCAAIVFRSITDMCLEARTDCSWRDLRSSSTSPTPEQATETKCRIISTG